MNPVDIMSFKSGRVVEKITVLALAPRDMRRVLSLRLMFSWLGLSRSLNSLTSSLFVTRGSESDDELIVIIE